MNLVKQTILQADAAQIPLASGTVHTVCTSPPYWSLRRYADAQDRYWVGGEYVPMPGLQPVAMPDWTGPLGLEPTPEMFVFHLVQVFRECWRVLRDDGVAWVIIGDSYGHGTTATRTPSNNPGVGANHAAAQDSTGARHGGNAGDLIGIPYRLMLALQGDGWIVRNDVVWSKKNCMPESMSGWRWERCRVKIKGEDSKSSYWRKLGNDPNRPNSGGVWRQGNQYDSLTEWRDCPGCDKCRDNDGYVLRRGSWRHTRAHETVLMLAKGMQYWADQEKAREPAINSRPDHLRRHLDGDQATLSRRNRGFPGHPDRQNCIGLINKSDPTGRNPRSVLELSSEPYPGAHYATYPSALIATLIRATCPAQACPECGAGWAAVVEKGTPPPESVLTNTKKPQDGMVSVNVSGKGMGQSYQNWKNNNPDIVHGYRPTCACNAADSVPGIVLDPFVGSGTTLAVCRDLGLRGIGLDLAHTYLDQQAKVRARIAAPSDALDDLPLFKQE